MTVRADLVAAIRANQEDLGLRLVYADYLEEIGDTDAAALVRIEVRRREIRLGTAVNCAELDRLFLEAIPIKQKLERRLFDEYHGHLGVHYFRGLPWQVLVGGNKWLLYADRLLAEHPLRQVIITSRPGWNTMSGRFADWRAARNRWLKRFEDEWPNIKFSHLHAV